jgi:hypothetical protein
MEKEVSIQDHTTASNWQYNSHSEYSMKALQVWQTVYFISYSHIIFIYIEIHTFWLRIDNWMLIILECPIDSLSQRKTELLIFKLSTDFPHCKMERV